MWPIYIEKCILVLQKVVLIERMVLIPGGLYNKALLYFYEFEFCKPYLYAFNELKWIKGNLFMFTYESFL